MELKSIGFSVHELKEGGYTLNELRTCRIPKWELKAAGFAV